MSQVNENLKASDSTIESAQPLFPCMKCSIKLTDVKLLKSHFWRVHISKRDLLSAEEKLKNNQRYKTSLEEKKQKEKEAELPQQQEQQEQQEQPQSNTQNKRKLKSLNQSASNNSSLQASAKSSKKMKTAGSKLNQSTNDSFGPVATDDKENDSLAGSADSIKSIFCPKKQSQLNSSPLTVETKYFNLSREPIDEASLAERVKKLFADEESSKLRDFKAGRIAWASWRQIKWPCVIKSSGKDAKGRFRVSIVYYEMNDTRSGVFKFDPTKVELFFRNPSQHFDFKEMGAIFKPSFNFFACYTYALRDFVKQLEQDEKDSGPDKPIEIEEIKKPSAEKGPTTKKKELTASASKGSLTPKDKYVVRGRMMSLDEVKEFANKEISQNVLNVKEERQELSKKLFEILMLPECKDYLISIVKEKTECKRHKKYLIGNNQTRKEMKFSSPGPLIVEHQQSLATLVIDVCTNHFQEKWSTLKTYDYDVLYPEAVIWALRKLENISYYAAEKKYKLGFKQTDEEAIKQRCNEILNKLKDSATDKSINNNTITNTSDAYNNDSSVTADNNDCSVIENNTNKKEQNKLGLNDDSMNSVDEASLEQIEYDNIEEKSVNRESKAKEDNSEEKNESVEEANSNSNDESSKNKNEAKEKEKQTFETMDEDGEEKNEKENGN